MGVPREELILAARALNRGFADLRGIRRALGRTVSKGMPLVEAMRLSSSRTDALRDEPWTPEPARDADLLATFRALLLEEGHVTPAEWDTFLKSLSDGGARRDPGPLDVPQEFDGCVLLWELVRRERGVIYRARDAAGREVAIKIFREGVPAGDLPRVGDLAYAAMDFVDGTSLEKPPALRRAVEALARAARITEARPHGALTPARILLGRDDAVTVVGYEHVSAVAPSERARMYAPGDDVRALGTILRELPGVGAEPVLRRIADGARAGAHDSPGVLADDLDRWLRGEEVATRTVPRADGSSRAPWIVAIAAVAVALVAVIAILLVVQRGEPAPETPTSRPPLPVLPGADPAGR